MTTLDKYIQRVSAISADETEYVSIVVFNGRYLGTGWFALACDFDGVPDDFISGDDLDLHRAWHMASRAIGHGETPGEAYNDLIEKLHRNTVGRGDAVHI